MKVTAVVMAGGRGKRLALSMEKPMLEVGGKPVVEYVLAALKNAKNVQSVVVTVSAFTPKTAAYLETRNVTILRTPGDEYVADLAYTIRILKLDKVLAVGADLPLITSDVIDDVVAHFVACGKPSLAVAVPEKTRSGLGMGPGYAFEHCGKRMTYAGLNMIEGKRIDEGELEQEIYVLDKPEVAVNINTVNELGIARKQFARLH